jgi:hypothetical protein
MAMARGPKKLIGQILLERGLITQPQLDEALNVQKNTTERLGRILVDMGYVTEKDVLRAHAEQLGIPFFDADQVSVDEDVAKAIPQSMVARYKAIPLRRSGNRLTVAMVDPTNVFALDDIRLVTGYEIESFIADSDTNQYDYCLGVTSAEYLKPFYPRAKEPGIKMPYLYLKENAYRINNLHIARLCHSTTGSAIQTVYDHRHQKNILNRIRMCRTLFKADHAKDLLVFYILAQVASLLSRLGLHRMALPFRQPLLLNRVEEAASAWLNMRFKAVETKIGGAALDIDDQATYKTITAVFTKWHAAMMPKTPQQESTGHCPFKNECHHPTSGERPIVAPAGHTAPAAGVPVVGRNDACGSL